MPGAGARAISSLHKHARCKLWVDIAGHVRFHAITGRRRQAVAGFTGRITTRASRRELITMPLTFL